MTGINYFGLVVQTAKIRGYTNTNGRPSGQGGPVTGHTDKFEESEPHPRELFYRHRTVIIETLCDKNLGAGLVVKTRHNGVFLNGPAQKILHR